eukprot:COSAG02_NODE_35141_length_473_cov_0.786096_1_plen_69_part_10
MRQPSFDAVLVEGVRAFALQRHHRNILLEILQTDRALSLLVCIVFISPIRVLIWDHWATPRPRPSCPPR